MSVTCTLSLLSMLLASAGGWSYEAVAPTPTHSPCRQAAHLGDELFLACRDGLWRGPLQKLRRVLVCSDTGGSGPHLEFWGRGLAFSCDGGLFFLTAEGEQRMATPGRVGALCARAGGPLLGVSQGALWRWDFPSSPPGLVQRLPEGAVADLRWRGGSVWILRWKGSLRWRSGRLERVLGPPGAWLWLDGQGRSHWIDGHGRRWTAPENELPRARQPLALLPGERMQRVRMLNGGRWMASGLRWWWRPADGSLRQGRLPLWSESSIPVQRPAEVLQPPWLIGTRSIHRPVPRRQVVRARRCEVRGEKPFRWEKLAMGRSLALPRLEISGACGRGLSFHRPTPGAWRWVGRRSWAVGIRLSWSLGDPGPAQLDRARRRVQLDWQAEGQVRGRSLARLRMLRQPLCSGGASQVDLEEIRVYAGWLEQEGAG